jgi:hypothetical protein
MNLHRHINDIRIHRGVRVRRGAFGVLVVAGEVRAHRMGLNTLVDHHAAYIAITALGVVWAAAAAPPTLNLNQRAQADVRPRIRRGLYIR